MGVRVEVAIARAAEAMVEGRLGRAGGERKVGATAEDEMEGAIRAAQRAMAAMGTAKKVEGATARVTMEGESQVAAVGAAAVRVVESSAAAASAVVARVVRVEKVAEAEVERVAALAATAAAATAAGMEADKCNLRVHRSSCPRCSPRLRRTCLSCRNGLRSTLTTGSRRSGPRRHRARRAQTARAQTGPT